MLFNDNILCADPVLRDGDPLLGKKERGGRDEKRREERRGNKESTEGREERTQEEEINRGDDSQKKLYCSLEENEAVHAQTKSKKTCLE